MTMKNPKDISILDFTYELPDERIALHPLPERDASKLLVYRDGQITETTYRHIANELQEGSMLVFNNTRVINARMRFRKSTGGMVEIFCLEPAGEVPEYQTVMNRTGSARWICLAGNASKWRDEPLSGIIHSPAEDIILEARKIEKRQGSLLVEFSWTPSTLRFAEVLELAGDVPLPPYIRRETVIDDKDRYQTIYAKEEGSVAAPTAGLHFTDRIFKDLDKKGISREYVTLHVGAGTFRPVKADTMAGHDMHAEWIDVSSESIHRLADQGDGIVAVGTTSLRTIESLYWLGVKASLFPDADQLAIFQWDVYEEPLADTQLTMREALLALVDWLKRHGRDRIFTQTQLLISPGYRFRVARALVTNFHQPQSTLLLLVAAMVGDDWRKIYQYALENGFRFLSYGDGSLLELKK